LIWSVCGLNASDESGHADYFRSCDSGELTRVEKSRRDGQANPGKLRRTPLPRQDCFINIHALVQMQSTPNAQCRFNNANPTHQGGAQKDDNASKKRGYLRVVEIGRRNNLRPVCIVG
jgi:hypothetical protein